MRSKRLRLSSFCVALAVVGCGGKTDNSASGGMRSLSPSGGSPATSLGGMAATGGSESRITAGRAMTGGAATGGVPTASVATGGEPTGSVATGGVPTGGVPTGSVATGGAPAGGTPAGNASTSSKTVSDPCSVTNVLSGGTKHCSRFDEGVYGSYQWIVDSNEGAGCLTTYENAGAAFSATWDNLGHFFAEVNLEFDGTEPYQQHGVLSADFAETHSGTAGTYSYIGVRGSAARRKSVSTADSGAPVAPVFDIEFVIIEDSFDGSPPATWGASKVGTVKADGGEYDVYYTVQRPGIYKVYSIRQPSRHCGHISISDQFSKWADLIPLSVGALGTVSIVVDVEGGTGSIDFTTADLTVH